MLLYFQCLFLNKTYGRKYKYIFTYKYVFVCRNNIYLKGYKKKLLNIRFSMKGEGSCHKQKKSIAPPPSSSRRRTVWPWPDEPTVREQEEDEGEEKVG